MKMQTLQIIILIALPCMACADPIKREVVRDRYGVITQTVTSHNNGRNTITKDQYGKTLYSSKTTRPDSNGWHSTIYKDSSGKVIARASGTGAAPIIQLNKKP